MIHGFIETVFMPDCTGLMRDSLKASTLANSVTWTFSKIAMMTEKPKRGGPNRGQGRKPLATDGQTVRINITMTAEQRDKLIRLGGSEWVRKKIDSEIG